MARIRETEGKTGALALLRETFEEWKEDDALQWGAALAYYAVFSLAPLLLVAVSVAGLAFGEEAAQGRIVGEIEGMLGREGAEAIEAMIANAGRSGSGVLGMVVGVAMALFGASGVFGQLQKALNHLWDVRPKPGAGWKTMVWGRLTALGLVLAIAFLLLVSLVLSAAISALAAYFQELLPVPGWVLGLLDFVLSIAVVGFLFGLIFKVLPDVEIAWRDVAFGALATAVLFTVGKVLIGLYLGHSSVGSSYGAAGSLIVLLVWIYYSAQLVFFGAELTQVWARHHGSRIVPSEHAVRVDEVVVEAEG